MPTGSTNLCILILCRNLFSLICLVLGGCGPVNRRNVLWRVVDFFSPARGVYQYINVYITIINYINLEVFHWFSPKCVEVMPCQCHANASKAKVWCGKVSLMHSNSGVWAIWKCPYARPTWNSWNNPRPKAKVMMSDDLLGFNHQKCVVFPCFTWFHHEKWWFKDQE